MINVALIGLGRIGQMHAENLFSHKSFKLKYTFDIDTKLNQKLSKKFNLPLITIADLIEYRRKHEKLVEELSNIPLPKE